MSLAMPLPDISAIHNQYLALSRVARERFSGLLGGKGGQQGNAVQGLLGALGGKQQQQQPESDQQQGNNAQQQKQQQQNPLGGVLGGLLGKKKPK